MFNKNKIATVIGVGLLALATACKQSAPPVYVQPEVKGDFAFSGHQWKYKDAGNPVGPGPNRFSGTADFAWVDASGKLHLKIAKKNNYWTCSEIVSTKTFGYGKYIMTCENDVSTFNENVVFGFFTWDNYSFQTQGNSEIDVEFSRWGKATDSNLLSYSAQPVWFNTPGPYAERTYKPTVATQYMKQPMTYMMQWTPDSVHWESYEGTNYPGTKKVSEWTFDKTNISRQKIEGSNKSNPIVIPAPSDSTNVRFNLWLLNGVAPSNGAEHEVIISNFKYIPM
jgi:Glycosyl hydrolases family 16